MFENDDDFLKVGTGSSTNWRFGVSVYDGSKIKQRFGCLKQIDKELYGENVAEIGIGSYVTVRQEPDNIVDVNLFSRDSNRPRRFKKIKIPKKFHHLVKNDEKFFFKKMPMGTEIVSIAIGTGSIPEKDFQNLFNEKIKRIW